MCQDRRKERTHRDYRTSVSEKQTINRHGVCRPDSYSVWEVSWDRVTGEYATRGRPPPGASLDVKYIYPGRGGGSTPAGTKFCVVYVEPRLYVAASPEETSQ